MPTRVPFRKLPKIEVRINVIEAEKPLTPRQQEALRLLNLSSRHLMSMGHKKYEVESAMVRIAISCPAEVKEAWLNPSRFGKSIRPEFLSTEFGKRFDSAIREDAFIRDEIDRGREIDRKIVALFWLLRKPWRNATERELSEVTGLTIDNVRGRLARIRKEDKTLPGCKYSPTAATIDRLAQIAIDNEGILPPPAVLSRMLGANERSLYKPVKALQDCGVVKEWERMPRKKHRKKQSGDAKQESREPAEEAA